MEKKIKNFFLILSFCFDLAWKSSKQYTILRIIGKIVTPLLSVISLFLVKNIIDFLLNFNHELLLGLYLQVFFILIIGLLTTSNSKLIEYTTLMHDSEIDHTYSNLIMGKTLSADLELFDNPDLYNKLNLAKQNRASICMMLWNVLDLLGALIACVCSISILMVTNIWYPIIIIASSIPMAILSWKYTKVLYSLDVNQIKDNRELNYLFEISTSKIHAQDIRLFQIQCVLKNKYICIWKSLFNSKQNKTLKRTTGLIILSCIPEITTVLLTFDIINHIVEGMQTVGNYTFLTGLITQLVTAINLLVYHTLSVYDNKLKFDSVQDFLLIKNNINDSGKLSLTRINKIEFKSVTFIYPGNKTANLKNISFTLLRGEKLAFVGKNGAGKTTIIKLLLRFYEPTEGEIYINNRSINDYTISSLRSIFTSYFQNQSNFSFTIRENIAISQWCNLCDTNKIIDCLHKATISEVLKNNNVDVGLTRLFDENGLELSGGQNQKIALARTFFKNCEVLLLDEPSSSLDPESENSLLKTINDSYYNKTIIFMTHRLTHIKFATRIIVIDDGKIIEEGTYDNLIKENGTFAKLYSYQKQKM